MSLPQNLSIHFEFFHKIPTNAITMYPVGSFQKTHKELTLLLNFRVKCEFFEKNPLGTLWSHWWVFCERTQNACSNFGANSLESELWKNPSISPMSFPLGIVVGTFKKYPPCTWWITGGRIEKFFWKYPPWAWWVRGGQIVSELTMNSPWACQVNTPLPPVYGKGWTHSQGS